MGVPDDAQVGISGLERALDDELRGIPGGELRAGLRTLATTKPQQGQGGPHHDRPARPAGRVDRARRPARRRVAMRVGGRDDGDVVAAAGIGLSGLQPPGLDVQDHHARRRARGAGHQARATVYPVADRGGARGRRAAERQRRVVRRQPDRLVRALVQLGLRADGRRAGRASGSSAPPSSSASTRTPGIDGAATSTIPAAEEIGDDLAVGSSAIGQGRVQASTLRWRWRRRRSPTAASARGRRCCAPTQPKRTEAVPPRVARIVDRGMRAVVAYGHRRRGGDHRRHASPARPAPPSCARPRAEPTPTARPLEGGHRPTPTAWFAAYAPAQTAARGGGVMLVEAGAGGDAAPAPAGASSRARSEAAQNVEVDDAARTAVRVFDLQLERAVVERLARLSLKSSSAPLARARAAAVSGSG